VLLPSIEVWADVFSKEGDPGILRKPLSSFLNLFQMPLERASVYMALETDVKKLSVVFAIA
jgi:hypothetical protein